MASYTLFFKYSKEYRFLVVTHSVSSPVRISNGGNDDISFMENGKRKNRDYTVGRKCFPSIATTAMTNLEKTYGRNYIDASQDSICSISLHSAFCRCSSTVDPDRSSAAAMSW
jgi:hypothetical protein